MLSGEVAGVCFALCPVCDVHNLDPALPARCKLAHLIDPYQILGFVGLLGCWVVGLLVCWVVGLLVVVVVIVVVVVVVVETERERRRERER